MSEDNFNNDDLPATAEKQRDDQDEEELTQQPLSPE